MVPGCPHGVEGNPHFANRAFWRDMMRRALIAAHAARITTYADTPRRMRRMTAMASTLRPQGYLDVLAYRREDLTPERSMALRCRELAKDTLQFNPTLFENFSAAMADATQVGAN
jgi:hypothetical protein